MGARVEAVLAWLARRGRRANVEGMARFGITSPRVYGVSLTTMRPLIKRLGRDQALAEALWATGWLEARLIAAFVANPRTCTVTTMNRWARDFDNWAVTDNACLHLFCHSPRAWGRVAAWRTRRREFEKRAAFALLAALAIHAPAGDDARCAQALELLVEAAGDERPYVRKAVNWALRQIGKRSEALRREALACAARIGARNTPAARWIAADARRELMSAPVVARVQAAARRATTARGPRRGA